MATTNLTIFEEAYLSQQRQQQQQQQQCINGNSKPDNIRMVESLELFEK